MLDQLQSVRALKARPPDVPFGLVPRPELAKRLTAATAAPVTLVCAGPGASKTSTVASWAKSAEAPWPIAWLSLDASDNTVQSFWSSVLFTLSECGGLPAGSRLPDITPAAGFGSEEILEIRAQLAELALPIVLVLDDFHEITDEGVLSTFGELVDHLPDPLRLVLISRSDPPLRLHRLRAGGQLTEIRTADLAFSSDETATLFQWASVSLRADQVAMVRERTEGWPVGLRLAAMSLNRGNADAGVSRLSGTDRAIADYLIGEVMQGLAPENRDFLMWTSVVTRINGPLADAITGRTDSHSMLEQFVRANAFVVGIGEGGGWFSYHRMLRDLLMFRLTLEQPDGLRRANIAAARWFSANGEPIEAIRHALVAGDREFAGHILVRVITKVLSPEGPALVAAITPLAAQVTEAPGLSTLLASAVCHFHRLDMPAMQRDVTAARQFLDEAGEARITAEVTLLLLDSAASRYSADSQAVHRITTRVTDLVARTPRRELPGAPAFQAIASINHAGAELWTGPTDGTGSVLADNAAQAEALGLLLPQLNALGHLALLEAFRGRCTSAERHATRAGEIIDRRGWGSEPQALATYLAQALVELARHRPTEAAHHVRRGLAASTGDTDRALRLGLGIARVEVMVGRKDTVGALTADTRVTEGLKRTPAAAQALRRWSGVAGAEALLLAGQPDQAIGRIADVNGVSGAADRLAATARCPTLTARERVCLARAALASGNLMAVPRLIDAVLSAQSPEREAAINAHLLRAVLANRNHRDAAAFSAVEAALDLANTEGIRRPFVSIGHPLAGLLVRYRQLGGPHAALAADVLELLEPASPSNGVPSASIVEPLTEREAIVLRYLPTMLKANEIAQELFVSVNTVKAHLRAIYRKLEAANRREAVEKARAAGLL